MSFVKTAFAALAYVARLIFGIPQAIRLRVRVMRRQLKQSRAEADRIDRIRHPSKYLGK